MTGGALKSLATAIVCAIFLTLGIAGPRAEPASSPKAPAEYMVKAAFLYNFAKFTQWPEGTFPEGAPLSVCVFGQDPFGEALQSIVGKSIRGREITVQTVTSVEAGAACHLLFISESEQERLDAILKALVGKPVLTIADFPDFARSGGIIRLKTNKEKKIRFVINIGTAKRAGLQLSSKLLNLAEIVSN